MRAFATVLLFVATTLAQEPVPLPPGTVEVRFTDPKGGPIQTARVRVLAVGKGAGQHRAVAGQPARELAPRDFPGDFARFENLPAGRFVLLVEADHHAPTLSEPFELPADTAPQVTVRLQAGATLEGIVTDPTGKPLAGVEVTTGPVGALGDDNPFAQLLAGLFVRTTTDATTRTGADGAFRFERVAIGAYRIRAHDDAFADSDAPLTVAASERMKVPAIALADGVFVSGTVLRGGEPVEGAEVVLAPALGGLTAAKGGPVAARLVAFTDAQGAYRMPARAPVRAMFVLSASEPSAGNQRPAQIKASRRTIAVNGGAASQVEDLQLPE